MTTFLEEIINKLLSNNKIEHYCENASFKEEIMDNQEAAEILVRIMEEEQPSEFSKRAGEMLSMCTISAILPLVRHARKDLPKQKVLEQLNLLSIARLIALQSDFDESKTTTEKVLEEVTPYLVPLLSDESSVTPTDYEEDVEEEYLENRVCDEALLILIYLSGMVFDEYSFQEMDYEQRNDIIKKLRNRFRPLVA